MGDAVAYKRLGILCPSCGKAHHATEVHLPVENDEGHWVVNCAGCDQPFVVPIRNPLDSGGAISPRIRAREEGAPTHSTFPQAHEMLEHNQDVATADLTYDYRAAPLYECPACRRGLDELALNFAETNFSGIQSAYFNAQNILLAGRGQPELAVITGEFECMCGASCTCAFYTPMYMIPGKGPLVASALLLAGIREAELCASLAGIMSKSVFMDILEKLVVRWRLEMDYVLIASPFVGYQQMPAERKVGIWKRVLSVLDPARTLFVSRKATWSDYRNALEAAGVPVDLLERFDLRDPVLSRRSIKQDFHAKVYAGVGMASCEVFSGSANLVDGPSLENMAFAVMDPERFLTRFLAPLRLKDPLPKPLKRAASWLHIRKSSDGVWGAFEERGSGILASVFADPRRSE